MIPTVFRHFKPAYQPLNKVTIAKSQLYHNYHYLSSLVPDLSLAPVLKSNAYGHGLLEIAKLLEPLHPPFLCVDSLYEGYELLKAHIKIPILIMGYIHPQSLKTKPLPFSFAVYDQESLQAFHAYQPQAKLHFFIDTGMHREGITLSQLPSFLEHAKQLPKLQIDGIMSHLAGGDQPDHTITKRQLTAFNKACDMTVTAGFSPSWFHCGATTALLHHALYKNKLGNLIRSGISLYGLDPNNTDHNLKPVLEFSTTLAQVKTVKKGETVGYDFTFTAPKDMLLGILPVGYNDGVDRRLSNRGSVLIENMLCLIVGRVSMNLTVVDLSKVTNPQPGMKAIIFSCDPNAANCITKVAALCQTIPYELLIHLDPSTKRVIVE